MFQSTPTQSLSNDDLRAELQAALKRTRQLEVVVDIAQIATSPTQLQETLQEALFRLIRVMDLDGGAVFLTTDRAGELELNASVGYSEGYARRMMSPKSVNHAPGLVTRTAVPFVVNDAKNERKLRTVLRNEETIYSYAAVPLMAKDQVVGVLETISRKPRNFEESDLELLTASGAQIAVVVENARLYERTAALQIGEERSWLAREIHDTIAQGLIGIAIRLELAETSLEEGDPESALQSVTRALRLTRSNLEHARSSVAHLRGDAIGRTSLSDALSQIAEEFGDEANVSISLHHPKSLTRLPFPVEDTLLRITREALNNIWKHAHATRVEIRLKRSGTNLELTVQDDGIGFDPSPHISPEDGTHMGIIGMQERTRQLNGELEIATRPGYGTLIRAILPTS